VEGIKNEGLSLVGRPGRGSGGMRGRFDPLLGSELVFDVNGVQRKFGQVPLTEVVDVDIDHSDGETKREHVSTGKQGMRGKNVFFCV
jgi:hypothetical protein